MLGLFGPIVIEPMRHLEIDAFFLTIAAGLTIGAFVLARLRPTLAVALLFVTNEIEWTHVHGALALSLSVLVGAAVGIAFLTQPALLRTLARPAVRIVGLGFTAVAGAMVLSAIAADHRELVAQELIKLLEYAITFLIAHAAFAAHRDDRRAFEAVALAAIVVSASALAQLITGAPAGFLLGASIVPRIAGLLAGPNQLAGYLGLLAPILLVAVLDTRSRLCAVALGLLAVALLFTFSRGGYFGAAVACLVVVQGRPVSKRARTWVLAASGVALVAIVSVVLTGKFGRILGTSETTQPDGLGTRTQLWHAALALFAQHPWTGVGAGNFETRLGSVGFPALRTHANSWYFEALADGGIALLGATILWIRSAVVVLVGCAPRRPYVLGALAATAGFAAHGLFDDLVFYPTVGAAWWLIVGVGAGMCGDGEIACSSENPSLA